MSTALWKLAYNCLALPMLRLYYRIHSRSDPKVKEGIEARKGLFERLESEISKIERKSKTVWFHFTSVGEFEQVKPIIENVREDVTVILTYFSPSVHPNVVRYPHKDVASYLPIDTRRNARRLFDLIKPDLLVFSKFDIWPNLVWQAARREVPVMVIAGTLHAESLRIRGLGRYFFASVHRHVQMHCAISEADADRFRQICRDADRVCVTGDTRFDQVYNRSLRVDERRLIPNQETITRPVLIAGSTYAQSEDVLIPAYRLVMEKMNSKHPMTLLLVPHEPTPEHVEVIRGKLSQHGLSFTKFTALDGSQDLSKYQVVIIDTVGILAALYKLGDIAFVGGSFKGSVHNVMEPAVMGKPVIFGPHIANAREASLLVAAGGALKVRDANSMAEVLVSLLSDPERARAMGKAARQVVIDNLGAADKTLKQVRFRLMGVSNA